jgi:predicted MPP superfamily phosphohydrolase
VPRFARLRSFIWSPRLRRALAVGLIGVIGAGTGLLVGGHVQTPVGPANVSMSIGLSWSGGTVVDIPPLGSLQLRSHYGPLRLESQVVQLRPAESQAFLKDPKAVDRLADDIGGQVEHGIIMLCLRGALFALLATALLAALVFRAWRTALWSTACAVVALALCAGIAFFSFKPASVAEPRYTGLIANAPQVVGDARTVVKRFAAYRDMLAKLVGNLSQLYATTSNLPVYAPNPETLRVLHVSDIHLNPLAWNIIKSVSTQFAVDIIIDSGDLTDHGTSAEEKFANSIKSLKVPYVFVRGNHDSPGIQAAVARQPNAVVLDNRVATVAGLRIFGVGDPRFTPDKTTRDDSVGSTEMFATGQKVAAGLNDRPDVVVVHDPEEGKAFDGVTPLVMAGHTHQRATQLLPLGTRLFVEGSTGSAGLRGLEGEKPTPVELSMLYFSRYNHRLQAWDDITLGGLGEQSVQIERHQEDQPDRPVPATTTPSPTPTPTTVTPVTTPPSAQPTG